MEQNRELQCIKELYELIDKIYKDACRHDLTLLRPHSRACGCDAYQGAPPIARIVNSITDKYEDIIHLAFKLSELPKGEQK